MTGSPPTELTRDLIIARLRAAGCVFAEDEAALLIEHAGGSRGVQHDPSESAHRPATLAELVAQRESGRPLEYLLGWAGFAGLRIPVTDGVFVPRRRSELLARLATQAARERGGAGADPTVVVDLCCGAGALGAAVASEVPDVDLYAADIDPDAVACARWATARYGGTACCGDLFDPLPDRLRGRVDVLIANAPYVPTGEIDFLPAEARQYERVAALDGGDDGLSVLRRIVRDAPDWLAPGGVLVMECADHQAASLADSVTAAGLQPEVVADESIDATAIRAAAPIAATEQRAPTFRSV